MTVNQVNVSMHFTLTGGGRIISEADAQSGSYAGADVSRMALTLVNEQADEVVAHAVFRLLPDRGRRAPQAGAEVAPCIRISTSSEEP